MQETSGEWKEWSKFVLIEIRRLGDEQKEFNHILNKQEQNLREHMRRSDILEQMQLKTNETVAMFHEELKPIKRKSDLLDSIVRIGMIVAKIIAFITSIFGLVYAVMSVIKK